MEEGAEEGVEEGAEEGVDDGVGEGEKKVEEEDVGHGFVAGQSIVEGLGHEPPCWAGLVVVQLLVIVVALSPQPDGHGGSS